MKKNNNKKVTLITIIALLITLLICVPYKNIKFTSSETKTRENSVAYNAENNTYLSDIPYIQEQSSVGWGALTLDGNLDSNANGGLITLIVNGQAKSFLKGITAHATSTVMYDLSNYNYDFFSTYYGVDAARGTNGNGVKFAISTSNNGVDWDLHTLVSPPVKKGNSEAEYIEVDIRNKKYLKLYCIDLGNQTADHCTYGNAMLYKDGYKPVENNEPVDFIKTVEEYDNLIKAHKGEEITGEYELLLLQREYVNKAGYNILQNYAKLSEKHLETVSWLFNDLNNLRLYINGGTPSGSYMSSLNVLKKLLEAHKSDFDIQEVTKYGTKYGDLYKKMAITLSLTHSTTVGLWMQPSIKENQSDALTRYEIYKEMHKNNKFRVNANIDIAKWFENYNIEEMRMVLDNALDDEEIIWLNEYTQSKIDENPNQVWSYLTPHPYMAYVWPNYSNPIFHDPLKKDYWDQKFNGIFSKYNVTYRSGLYKVWMNFRNEYGTGAVCGGISKTGSNIRNSHGIPAEVIGQPGHAALLYYSEDANGNGYWGIDNDVSGWTLSEKSERMLLGWGNASYSRGYSVVYMVLAQEVLNDYDRYEKSQENVLLANSYESDLKEQEKLYRKALEIQPLNINAWYELIQNYNKRTDKSEDEYYELAKELAEDLKYFPLPMYHLTNLISPKLTSIENKYKFTLLQTRILKEASQTPNNTADTYYVYQPSVTRTEANYLLGRIDSNIATFSFDGDNAGKIVLSSKFDSSGVRWDYSLDNGTSWQEVSFAAEEEHKWQLTENEIASITAENDIRVHIVGVNYEEENIFKIDITNGVISKDVLYGNDLENRVIGVDTSFEWKNQEEDEWTSYKESSPNNAGDKTLYIRKMATKTQLASNVLDFTFTTDNQPDNRKYISVSHLSIAGVSTEATSNGGAARNAIDGNYNTRFHSAWNGTDTERYITIKLDKIRYISAVEFVPAGGGNGKIYDGTIYGSLDGVNWEVLSSMKNLTYTNQANTIEDAIANTKSFEIENPKEVQFIKIVADKTNGNWFTAREFNLYQDLTINPRPTAGIAYDKTTPTNQNVIARLINPSTDITITNNGGSDTYIFTDNDEFTFEFVDGNGMTGSTTAKVDWIDRESPTAKINYSTTNPTNQEVIATLTDISEEVTILNNNGAESYTFSDNGTFTFEIEDKAGNKTSIEANVNWIDVESPTARISYDIQNATSQNVIASIIDESEEITILNNNGSREYTFKENGTFTFIIQDKAGNVTPVIANVSWINKTLPTAEIEYSTTEKTKDPVIATLKNPIRPITVINNNGEYTYTFTENGKFEFLIQDELGNVGAVLAKVDWIEKEENPGDDKKPIASTIITGCLTVVQDELPTSDITDINNSEKTENKIPTINGDKNNSETTLPEEEDSTTPIEDNVDQEENKEFEYYQTDKVTLKAPITISEEKIILKAKELMLPKEIQNKVNETSEYFELYFENEQNEIANVESVPMTMTVKTDTTKKMVGVYEVIDDNQLIALNYQKLGNNQIELSVNKLGKYIIAYEDTNKEDKTETNNQAPLTKETKNKNLHWLIASGALLLVLVIGIILIKRK